MNLSVASIALAFAVTFGPGAQALKQQQSTPILSPAAQTVEQQVESYFSDIPIMVAISGCESHYRQYNTDGTVFRGEQNHLDVGVMQINEHYHLDTAQAMGLDIHTLDGNMAYARYLYDHEGTAPWSSSEYCWDPNGSKLTHGDQWSAKSIATAVSLN